MSTQNNKIRSRTEYSMLNIAAGVGGYVVSVVLSLINRMVFTRCLPPAYLGISGLFSNVLSMLSLAELGVGGAIVYALYKPLAYQDEKKIASLVRLYGKAYCTIGTVIGCAGLCLLPFLNLIIGQQPDIAENIHVIYLIFLFNVASSYFFTYRSTLLVAAQKNYLVTGLNYFILCIQAIVQAVFLFATRHYIGYLLIQCFFSLLNNVWISHIAVKHYPYIKNRKTEKLLPEERKKIFRDMRDLMAYKISGVLVNSTDNLIITFFSGLATTGLASNYTLLTSTLNTLLNQVFNGLSSSIGNLNAVESKEKKFSMLKVTNLLNFWLISWGALGIIFVSSDLVRFLFGDQYALSVEIPMVMALNFYTVGMQNAFWTFKHTMGLFRYGKFMQIGTAVLNLVFSIALGMHWGLFGILFATFLARLFTNLWYDPYVIYKHAFHRSPLEYLSRYIRFFLILLLEIVICNSLICWIRCPLLPAILLKSIIVSLVSNLMVILFFRKVPEFVYLNQIASNILRIIRNLISGKRKNA